MTYEALRPLIDDWGVDARYLLLHNNNEVTHFIRIIRIKEGGPKVYSLAQLTEMGYPVSSSASPTTIYLVFNLFQDNSVEKELRSYHWKLDRIIPKGKERYIVHTIPLSQLLKVATP